LRFDQLAKMTDGRLLTVEQADRVFRGVSVDSRTIASAQLFFAICGDNNDGHRFIDQAIAGGAAGVVSQTGYFAERPLPDGGAVVEVPDTHAAMLRLAEEYLKTTRADRIGITGSNGKTTTKEFAFRLLNVVAEQVYRSPGNYNNLFGVPLALLAMPVETDVAVLEMGISVPGEMARLAALVRPHIVVITNVAATHLEYLGSVENVAREKLQAMQYAQPGAPLIINADDPVLVAEADRVSSSYLTFGIKNQATFAPDAIEKTDDGLITVTIEGCRFHLPLFGEYQIYNLMAAYAIARTLGYSFARVATDEIELATAGMRGELVEVAGMTFISDCYNANPESVRAGLKSLDRFPGGERRVIILGDMLELGSDSPRYHTEVGEQLGQHSLDLIVAVGPKSKSIIAGAKASGIPNDRLLHFDNAAACAEQMVDILRPGDLVYLKGSRGIGLETVIQRFTANKEQP